MSEREDWLQEGVAALRAGDRREAIRLLGRAVNENPDNVAAWWFLAAVLPNTEQKIHALRHVLRLRPDHAEARELLKRLRQRQASEQRQREEAPPAKPEPTPEPRRLPRGCWMAIGMAGALGLIALAGLVLLLVTGLAGEALDLLMPEGAPGGRLLLMSVPVCEAVPTGQEALIFRNESGLTIEVLGGAPGQEQTIATLAAGEEGGVVAGGNARVRYVVRSRSAGVRGSAATYEIPPGSVCRVTVR
ncbi:MAG: tetratricopeptide repeat protein [Aggregatilineales bacterium]|nr:tetratricopeptide repeat protein [Chloroflexota bacterium]HOA23764.1 tetratricopeptide repeat protein [Aggregatilineales bacterium]HPV06098.1 tetratricopeptide repeat protein [Aggregatilineales bacterium]HQE20176.1 tetratricopeptide repeat protein [Aggregatilineales bacterium]